MSTRALIKVEGSKVVLYKHWDGGPESTLPWLENFNKDFETNRPKDIEYKVAQLVRSSARDAEKYDLDNSLYTGWGLFTRDENVDVDYVYELKMDGSVVVKNG